MEKSYVLLLIMMFSLSSCNEHVNLTDYYWIEKYSKFPEHSHEKYVFSCQLGCKSDPFIGNVNQVYWDDKIIILLVSDFKKGYVVMPSGDRLSCCNNDLLIGPFSNLDSIESILEDKGIDKSKLKKKSFEF